MKQQSSPTTQKCDEGLLATLEAVLFMHGTALKNQRLAEIVEQPPDVVRHHVRALRDAYDKRGGGLTILLANDTTQMVTHSNQAKIIERFTRKELEGELSQAGFEVLAIIAYRGPIAKPDIEAIRGVNCSFTLRNLLLRGLVEHVAHPTDHRTKRYRVTGDVLRVLGIDKPEDLPAFETLARDHRIDAILYNQESPDDQADHSTQQ